MLFFAFIKARNICCVCVTRKASRPSFAQAFVHGKNLIICASTQLVEDVIRDLKPQVVMVELDAYRSRLLPPGEVHKVDMVCKITLRILPFRHFNSYSLFG